MHNLPCAALHRLVIHHTVICSTHCKCPQVLFPIILCADLMPACQPNRAAGFETIMMNCNPETVSTDYDTSNRLYFEPITVEDVLNVIEVERPEGIIVQVSH